MTLVADENGVVSGYFTVPANTPTGTVSVEVEGDSRSHGATTYTGTHEVTVEQRRTITTVYASYDPLAQTFMLSKGRHIAGVDLWFYACGTSRVQVQIRNTISGYPGRQVLAQATLKPRDINTNGSATRVTWRPIWLPADEEFAIVVLTDDDTTALCIAEVGQYDSTHGITITKQPYQTGVFLSSSNASTWTAHQNTDLTFRLLACKFTEKEYIVDLGKVAVEGKTDLIVRGNVERVSSDTDVEFVLVTEDGTEYTQSEGQSVALQSELSGEATLKMKLKGNQKESPAVYQGVQLVLGKQRTEGDYITRSIPAGTNSKVQITYEVYRPGNATVNVYYYANDMTWQLVPLKEGTNVGDGLIENTHVIEGYNKSAVKIKIVLGGNAQYRPFVKNLRVTTV